MTEQQTTLNIYSSAAEEFFKFLQDNSIPIKNSFNINATDYPENEDLQSCGTIGLIPAAYIDTLLTSLECHKPFLLDDYLYDDLIQIAYDIFVISEEKRIVLKLHAFFVPERIHLFFELNPNIVDLVNQDIQYLEEALQTNSTLKRVENEINFKLNIYTSLNNLM